MGRNTRSAKKTEDDGDRFVTAYQANFGNRPTTQANNLRGKSHASHSLTMERLPKEELTSLKEAPHVNL